MNRRNEFLTKLKALFEEYNASVGFECSPGSDLFGVYEEKIVFSIVENDNGRDREINVLEVDGYYVNKNDIEL